MSADPTRGEVTVNKVIRPSWGGTFGWPALVVCMAWAAYALALRNGFVWDDTALVLRDPLIRSWRLVGEVFRHYLFLDATASGFYRPVQRLTYVWDYALFGFEPWGYHLTSVLTHAGAGVALYAFARQFLRVLAPMDLTERSRRIMAGLVAVVWTVHPVNSAAVTYVAGRADPLAAGWTFLGLFLALRGLEVESRTRAVGMTALATTCFGLGMLSKEIGLVGPGLWLGVFLPVVTRPGAHRRRWLLTWTVLAVGLFLGYATLRLSAWQLPPPSGPSVPWQERPGLALRALAIYGGLILFPWNLRMERGVLGDTAARTAFWEWGGQLAVGLAIATGLVWWLARSGRSRPGERCALLAFVVTYLPISDLFSLNATVAEHWLYLSLPFLLLAVALALGRHGSNYYTPRFSRRRRWVATGMLAGWVVALTVRTAWRNADWRDQDTFFRCTVQAGGDSARMFINLGLLESSRGHTERAEAYLQEALRRVPDQQFALLNLASLTLRERRFAETRAYLERIRPDAFSAPARLETLALTERAEGTGNGLVPLDQALALRPRDWRLRRRRVAFLREAGRQTEAVHELTVFLREQPFRAESWELLGDLLVDLGQPRATRRAYRRAAALDVHNLRARQKAEM